MTMVALIVYTLFSCFRKGFLLKFSAQYQSVVKTGSFLFVCVCCCISCCFNKFHVCKKLRNGDSIEISN